jgi:hypothetical protein
MTRREAIAKATITTTTASSSLLLPERTDAFLWRLRNSTQLRALMRGKTTRASSGYIDKAYVNKRIIRKAVENSDDGYRAGPGFAQLGYSTVKVRLPWEMTRDVERENIEGATFSADLEAEMSAQFAADLEDLSINGDTADTSGDAAFLTINDGLLKQFQASGPYGGYAVHRVDATTIASGHMTYQHLRALIDVIPAKYRNIGQFKALAAEGGQGAGNTGVDNYRGLRWLMNSTTYGYWVDYLLYRTGIQADAILVGGNPNLDAPFRIPIQQVESFPDGRIVLADPKNFVIVNQLEVIRYHVTPETDKELAATDKEFWVFFLKEDVLFEEGDAISELYGLLPPVAPS